MKKSISILILVVVLLFAVSVIAQEAKVVVIPITKVGPQGPPGPSVSIYDAGDNFVAHYIEFQGNNIFISTQGYFSEFDSTGTMIKNLNLFTENDSAIYTLYTDLFCKNEFIKTDRFIRFYADDFLPSENGWVGTESGRYYYVPQNSTPTFHRVYYQPSLSSCQPYKSYNGFPVLVNDPAVTGFENSYTATAPLKAIISTPPVP